MLQGIMQSTRKVKAMATTKRETRMRPRSPRPVTNLRKSSGDKERRKNRRKLESKLKDELSIVSTATEVQGQERRPWLHPRRIFKCLPQQCESKYLRESVFSGLSQCKYASGIHDISLLFNMIATLTSTSIRTPMF